MSALPVLCNLIAPIAALDKGAILLLRSGGGTLSNGAYPSSR